MSGIRPRAVVLEGVDMSVIGGHGLRFYAPFSVALRKVMRSWGQVSCAFFTVSNTKTCVLIISSLEAGPYVSAYAYWL